MAETSTETLRRLLDERGVKYRDYFHADKTWWSGRENVGWYAENRPSANGLYVMIEAVLTPAQVIAATLGAGTCHNAEIGTEGYFKCSECGTSCSVDWECSGWDVPHFCPNCGRKKDV